MIRAVWPLSKVHMAVVRLKIITLGDAGVGKVWMQGAADGVIEWVLGVGAGRRLKRIYSRDSTFKSLEKHKQLIVQT